MPSEAILQPPAESQAHGSPATHKFIRDVFFSNLPVPFQKFRTYIWLAVFSRTLGPVGYGAWALFTVSLGIAVSIGSLNVGSAMMRFLCGEKTAEEIDRSVSTVFSIVGAVAVALGILIVGFSNWGSVSIFHDRRDRVLILLLAATLPFECLYELAKSFLRARRLNRNWAILTLSRMLPEALATIIAGWWLASAKAVASTYFACGALAAIASVIYLIRGRRIHFSKPSKAIMARYLSFGVPLMPGALAYTLSVSSDRYLVSYFLGLKQVGIYSVCFTISALAFFLVGPINDVLFPDLSALYDSGRRSEFVERFSGIQRFVFGFAMGAAALLSAFPTDVLRLLSSRDFTSGSATLAILGIQGIFMALVVVYSVMFPVRLKVWSYSVFWVASGAVIVALDLVLLPRMGIAGAAVSQLVATGGGAVVVVGMHWQLFRQSFRPVWFLQNAIAFAAPFVVMAVWPHSAHLGGLESCLRLIAGSGAFIFGLIITRYLRSSDLKLFHAALLKRRLPVSADRLA